MYDKAFAKQLGVSAQDVNDFIGWEKNMEMMRAIPHTCSEKELLIHCLAAKKIIDANRLILDFPDAGIQVLNGR